MRKIFTIALMILGVYAKAQVVLEHSYSTNWQMEVVNIEGEGYKYLGVDTTSKDIKIYNTDHSPWKTINTNVPQSAIIYSVGSYASKYLFNADNKIEVLVLYAITPSYVYKAELYNEDGLVLNTFNDAVACNIVNVNGDWKLLMRIHSLPSHSDIYSLPGQWTGVSIMGKTTPSSNIFPNPIEQTSTINYTLADGIHHGVINIYNTAGTVVRSYSVTNQFNDLLINKGDLPAGVYIYDISTSNGRQTGQRFIIR